MIGKKTLQQKSFYGISLEQPVSGDNFYRRIDADLNLDFIYPLVKYNYGNEGQQRIARWCFFKICLVGYLNTLKTLVFTSFSLQDQLNFSFGEGCATVTAVSSRVLFGRGSFLSILHSCPVRLLGGSFAVF